MLSFERALLCGNSARWPWAFGRNCTQLGFKYFLGKRLRREVWCRQGNDVLRQICGWLLRSNARRPFGGLLACVGAAKSVRKRNLSPIPRPQPRRQGGQTEAALVIGPAASASLSLSVATGSSTESSQVCFEMSA